MKKLVNKPIITDCSGHELNEFENNDFPVSLDEQAINIDDIHDIVHWHYEIQINLVIEGQVMFSTPDGSFLVKKGEGFFINSEVKHRQSRVDNLPGKYICLNISPDFFYRQQLFEIKKKYIDSVIMNKKLQSFPLQSELWHKRICDALENVWEISQEQEFAYELKLVQRIYGIWYIIVSNSPNIQPASDSQSSIDIQRVTQVQKVLHANYSSAINLDYIASSIHLSKGECCRAFKRVMGVSPMQYLKKYRISQSMKLLKTTDMSINDIAFEVGFESCSYFIECFHREVNITPRAFRSKL